jgi:hypothetical protein
MIGSAATGLFDKVSTGFGDTIGSGFSIIADTAIGFMMSSMSSAFFGKSTSIG